MVYFYWAGRKLPTWLFEVSDTETIKHGGRGLIVRVKSYYVVYMISGPLVKVKNCSDFSINQKANIALSCSVFSWVKKIIELMRE